MRRVCWAVRVPNRQTNKTLSPEGESCTLVDMDAWTVMGWVAAAAASGGLGWVILARARERAVARAEVLRLEGEAARLQREREVVASEARLAQGQVGDLRVQVAALGKDLQSTREARDEAARHAQQLHQRDLESMREQFEQEVETERQVHRERLETLEQSKLEIKTRLAEFDQRAERVFKAVASDALKGNTQQFLELAEQKFGAKQAAIDELVKPIAETLKRTDAKLAVIESAGQSLKDETGKLVRALREPHVRGRYGEIQLKRVAELAGMSALCDFVEQDQTRDADGNALRPDMIVRLPNDRVIVVDAKTNIQGYLDALSASTPEEAEGHLGRFARHVSEQAAALSRKKYWSQYEGSPEFVVMFIPGDQFVDAALQRQPEILERAAEQGVILASPATLIGLLRAVAVGYREQQLAKAAEELRELGKQLHERVAIAMSHAARVGKAINSAAEAYNEFVGSYEKRVEPTLKRFESSGVKSAKELPETPKIVVSARVLNQSVSDRSLALPFGSPEAGGDDQVV